MKHQYDYFIEHPDWNNICIVCGTHYHNEKPDNCSICNDERQYVLATGQKWTSYSAVQKEYTIGFSKVLPNVYDLRVCNPFGIKQRAHLLISPGGNLLWDCLPFIDEASIAFIKSKGGLKGIAISHPHYYGLMAAWANAFECPIYLHRADRKWVMDVSDKIVFFNETHHVLWDEMKIVHTGGHFAGSTVLHAPNINQSGSLFVGDTLQISLSRRFISMMYSYPNAIPLPLKDILSIKDIVIPLKFDSMYGAFEWQNIHENAKELFIQSVERYKEVYELPTNAGKAAFEKVPRPSFFKIKAECLNSSSTSDDCDSRIRQ